MKTPETSRLFTRWENPANGVASHILTARAAPVQQSFYYTHPSFSADGRYLWLGCGYPPPGGKHAQQVLGVVDFEKDELRVYHETQFGSSRPVVDPATGEVYWCNQFDLWKRGPRAEDVAARVNRFPAHLARGRLFSLATHPTFSADGTCLNIDARFVLDDGTPYFVLGDLPLDGSPFRHWTTLEGRTFDHALFSPTDPDAQMFANEYWGDHGKREPFDGLRPYHRMWIIRRGGEARPILREPVSHSGHEWWDADGEHVWYLHYGVGVKKVRVADGSETLVWPGALSHAHSDKTGRYLVADRMDDPGVCECNVLFRDNASGKVVEIVNVPPLAAEATQCLHLHPHPQFCLDDRYICHTTIVHGRVDVALVAVDGLLSRV